MADDFVDARTHQSRTLCSSLRFKTYSDAKLAGLFLENDFPVVLFKKLFDVIIDPEFKADEITFHDIWDMFEYVSDRRRKDATKRDAAATLPDTAALQQVTAEERNIPPLVLELVVDRFIEDRMPLGVAAMEPRWESAYDMNGADLRRMSLVHRSWTYIAQRGLRQRAVIPYNQINMFLLSPFCGPWITEMIIYWTVNNGDIGVTRSDIWCLEALLERTPNVRSLALVTSLVWPISHANPAFDVDTCLEIISELLPNLQNLWLKHCDDPTRRNRDRRLLVCSEIRSLFQYIPQMRSLKFLSLRAWGSRTLDDEKQHSLNWDDHPPRCLKSVELNLSGHFLTEDLDWLLKGREEYQLESLSVCVRNPRHHQSFIPTLRQSLQVCLQGMKGLQLCILNESSSPGMGTTYYSMYTNILGDKDDLVSLDLFIMDERNFDLGSFVLPPNLERLALHFCDERFLDRISSFSSSRAQFTEDLKEHISRLAHLRTLLVTGSPTLPERADERWDLDAFAHHMNDNAERIGEDRIPRELLERCKDRNIEFILLNNAFPRQWEIPQHRVTVYLT